MTLAIFPPIKRTHNAVLLTWHKSHQLCKTFWAPLLFYLICFSFPALPLDTLLSRNLIPEGSGWAIPTTFRLLVCHYYYCLFFFCSFPFAPVYKRNQCGYSVKISSIRLILEFPFVISQIKMAKVRILENSYMLT